MDKVKEDALLLSVIMLILNFVSLSLIIEYYYNYAIISFIIENRITLVFIISFVLFILNETVIKFNKDNFFNSIEYIDTLSKNKKVGYFLIGLAYLVFSFIVLQSVANIYRKI